LLAQGRDNLVTKVTSHAWGARYQVDCNCPTPDGSNPCIRSVWELAEPCRLPAIDHGTSASRLKASCRRRRLLFSANRFLRATTRSYSGDWWLPAQACGGYGGGGPEVAELPRDSRR
jgi:hypothetical protein